MKNIYTIWLYSILAIVFVGILVSSCNKKFDEPPTFQEPNIIVTTTIKDLKAIHTVLSAIDAISGDKVIAGIVVCDDKSGNYYKQIAIQDATGGLLVRLDASNLYTTFPVGRKVYVKLKGLYISDYGGVCQIGVLDVSIPSTPALGTIPAALFDNYLVKGSLGNVVTPKVVTVAQLGTTMQDPNQSTLIQLDNFEFSKGDTNTFADPTRVVSAVNYIIKNCSGESITLRNSSYTNFSSYKVPRGNGSIFAIASSFGSTKQLTIRDTSDVKFYGGRCAIFEEDFETSSTGVLATTGWENIAETGNVNYTLNSFGGTKFAQVSAFSSSNIQPKVTSWLISPAIALTGLSSANLNFQTIDGFNNGATFTVLVSTNYTGSATPSTATWTTLASSAANPSLFSGPTSSGYASSWKSASISLATYIAQTVYIGFRYDGANPSSGTKKTSTWEVDNVKVTR